MSQSCLMLRETGQHRHYPPRYFLRVQGPQPYFLWTDLQNAPELSLYTLASNCLITLFLQVGSVT